MMNQVISLSKYIKVLVPSMVMCNLILGTFIYPLTVHADNTVNVTINGSAKTYRKLMGLTDVTLGQVLVCSLDYWGVGYSLSQSVSIGDRITVGIFLSPTPISGPPSGITLGPPPPNSVCTKKKDRLDVLYHGRVKANISV